MTSKQRAYLKGLAMNIDPIFQIGKGSVTPEIVMAIEEAFNTHELIKVKFDYEKLFTSLEGKGLKLCEKTNLTKRASVISW